MRLHPPLALEVAAARGVGALSRRLGRGGGTTIPGKLLAELDRGAIDRLAARLPNGTAVISATNGKTTTTSMAAEILRPRHRLANNAAGANEVVRTLVDGGAPRVLVVALNDEIADGRDVSWIWDVDFEPLLAGVTTLVAGGSRAYELALRFRYGGLDEHAIEVVPDLDQALDRGLELTEDGGELVVLPTYTAMLGLQRLLASRGLAKPYWERSG